MSPKMIQSGSHVVITSEIDGDGQITTELISQIGNALDQAEDRGADAVLLLHAIGHSAPSAVRHWPGETSTQSINKWERLLRRLERAGLPVFTLAQQACSALALELLLVADHRIVTSNFSMIKGAPGGAVWPGMSLYRLTRQIGETRARKLLLREADLTASFALDLDVVDEMTTDFATGFSRISHLLTHAPLDDFAMRRRLMQDSFSTTFDDALGAHLAGCNRAMRRSATINPAIEETADNAPVV